MKKQIKILFIIIFLSIICTYNIKIDNVSNAVNLNSIIEEPINQFFNIKHIKEKIVLDIECNYIEYSIPTNNGFKSYMGYTTITSKSSKQYDIQQNYAYTGTYGIRQVNQRYCIALGSYTSVQIGQYVDLILENNTVIPCIVAEVKSDEHTDSNNLFTISNNCCSEFIVDINNLYEDAKQRGDISYCCEKWNSPVTIIKVYNKNIYK